MMKIEQLQAELAKAQPVLLRKPLSILKIN
jgi:hypothetical protein